MKQCFCIHNVPPSLGLGNVHRRYDPAPSAEPAPAQQVHTCPCQYCAVVRIGKTFERSWTRVAAASGECDGLADLILQLLNLPSLERNLHLGILRMSVVVLQGTPSFLQAYAHGGTLRDLLIMHILAVLQLLPALV